MEMKTKDTLGGNKSRVSPEHHGHSVPCRVPDGGPVCTFTLSTNVCVHQMNCGWAFVCWDEVMDYRVPGGFHLLRYLGGVQISSYPVPVYGRSFLNNPHFQFISSQLLPTAARCCIDTL